MNALVQDWLPALDGVIDKLKVGATVADVACGHGLSTIFMATRGEGDQRRVALAYIRGLAELCNRNADWAERAMREAASLSSAAALHEKVIDLAAAEMPRCCRSRHRLAISDNPHPTAEANCIRFDDRTLARRRPEGAAQAAPYSQACLRPASDERGFTGGYTDHQ